MAAQIPDSAIVRAAHRFSSMRGEGILANLLAFSRVLHEIGIKVSLSQVIDAVRALRSVDIARKADFYTALSANLVSAHAEIAVFDQVFALFWQGRNPDERSLASVDERPEFPGVRVGSARLRVDADGAVADLLIADRELKSESEAHSIAAYSLHSSLRKKDFGQMGIEESRAVSRAILCSPPKSLHR